MAAPLRPTFPRWATQDIVNPISGEYNVYEPSEQKKDLGWDYNEVPPRQYFNWLARQTELSLEYVEAYTKYTHAVLSASQLPTANASNAGLIYSINTGGIYKPVYCTGSVWKEITLGATVV